MRFYVFSGLKTHEFKLILYFFSEKSMKNAYKIKITAKLYAILMEIKKNRGRCGGGELGKVAPAEGVAEDCEAGCREGETSPLKNYIIEE